TQLGQSGSPMRMKAAQPALAGGGRDPLRVEPPALQHLVGRQPAVEEPGPGCPLAGLYGRVWQQAVGGQEQGGLEHLRVVEASRLAPPAATAWLGHDLGCLDWAAPERSPLPCEHFLKRQDAAEALEMHALGLIEHFPQLLQEPTD